MPGIINKTPYNGVSNALVNVIGEYQGKYRFLGDSTDDKGYIRNIFVFNNRLCPFRRKVFDPLDKFRMYTTLFYKHIY